MPEEIPWNSSVFPEKASSYIPRKPDAPPILNLPQRGVPQGYRSTPGHSSLTRDIARQPTRPLRANPLPPGFNQPWSPQRPVPFIARPAPAFPPAQPIRLAPQVAPTHFTGSRQTPAPWLTQTTPQPVLARLTPLGLNRPPAQPARPAPRPMLTRFTAPAPQRAPAWQTGPAPVLVAQAGRMPPLAPTWQRQTLPPPPIARLLETAPPFPLLSPREDRNQAGIAPQPDNHAHLHLQISTSAWRKAARASQSRLLLASTLLFLIAMLIVSGLMTIHH